MRRKSYGRRKLPPDQIKEALRRYRSGELTEDLAAHYGVHRMSMYRYLNEAGGDAFRDSNQWRQQRGLILRNWMTAGQAAELLAIERRTVCDICRRGRLPGAFRMGDGPTAVWLIPRASVTARLSMHPSQEKEPEDDE